MSLAALIASGAAAQKTVTAPPIAPGSDLPAGTRRPAVGPVPAFVLPAAIPPAPSSASGAAIVDLLADTQMQLTDQADTSYQNYVYRVETAKGLGDAGMQVSWDPDLETLTFHHIRRLRDGKATDLLGDGSALTVIRREPNLEQATLDGRLTASLQPEDLRVGDTLDIAYTRVRRDPAMRGHSETLIGPTDGVSVGRYRLRLLWPSSKPVQWRAYPGALKPVLRKFGSDNELLADLTDVRTSLPPAGAPSRFTVINSVDVSDFASWAAVSATLAPAFAKAGTLAANSPLRAEAARIAAVSRDPRVRAELALQLVEQKVRYLFLSMRDGGYIPADADLTWTRRFGDCKAKTVLLIALLNELGIEARPVLVNTGSGDFVSERLPALGAFNHVIAQATIAGQTYWLDGTRLGDTKLDRLVTPNYRSGLPILARNAALVPIVPAPLRLPSEDINLVLDSTAGIDTEAKALGELRFRGDSAVDMRLKYLELSQTDRDQEMRKLWRKNYDFVTPTTVAFRDEAATGDFILTMAGTAKMNWTSESSARWYELDGARVGWKFDIVRDGQINQNAPFVFDHPDYWSKRETIKLPMAGKGFTLQGGPVDTEVNGLYAFHRAVAIKGDSLVMEASTRSLKAELPAAEAVAARTAMGKLGETGVYIRVPDNYMATDGDIAALAGDKPALAKALLHRGAARFDDGDMKGSEADIDAAIAADPAVAASHAIKANILARRQDKGAGAEADNALAIDPKMGFAWNAKATAAFQANQTKDAEVALDHALEADGKNAPLLTQRAAARLANSKFAEALTDADAAIAIDPLPLARTVRGAALAGLGRGDEALEQLDHIELPMLKQAQALHLRAQLRLGKARNADARADIDLLIAEKPSAKLYLFRAATWLPAERERGDADVELALKVDPKSVEAWLTKAGRASDQRRFDLADAALASAAAIAPKSRDVASSRVQLASLRGDRVTALRFADAMVAQYPDATALNERCWLKATLNVAFDTALADCEKALALAPGRASILDSRGFVRLRSGALDAAITDYDAALKASPSQSASLYGRGLARARKGDTAAATADLAAARKIDPKVDQRFRDFGMVTPGDPVPPAPLTTSKSSSTTP